MPLSFASCAGILLLSCALVGFSRVAPAQTSDESGTLVMVARTADAVILSVDSTITHREGRQVTFYTDGDRKLVNVGEKSACAVEKGIGKSTDDLDVSAALRRWVQAHPKMEAHEGIGGLLEEAAKVWDRNLLNGTRSNLSVGSVITRLVCGDIVDGHPVIIRGSTIAESDGHEGQVAEGRVDEPFGGDLLYVEGVIDTNVFDLIFTAPPMARIKEWQTGKPFDTYPISEDLTGNKSAVAAFKLFQFAAVQSMIGHKPAADGNQLPYVPSSWSQSDVKDLLIPVFSAVESHIEDVGTPNNVRIITPCGRFETTVEAETWPTCPPPVAVVVKKKKKHWW
jgi:hypothetical protein